MNSSTLNLSADRLAQVPEQSPYQPPVLRALGDIREMTLGGSLGTGDSGNAAVQKF